MLVSGICMKYCVIKTGHPHSGSSAGIFNSFNMMKVKNCQFFFSSTLNICFPFWINTNFNPGDSRIGLCAQTRRQRSARRTAASLTASVWNLEALCCVFFLFFVTTSIPSDISTSRSTTRGTICWCRRRPPSTSPPSPPPTSPSATRLRPRTS